MRQLLQRSTGAVEVLDVPVPKLLPGCVRVRVATSLVSSGTERASSEFASKNLLQKAWARPDLVREVFGKIRRDGVFSAAAAVRSRLDQPSAMGYSCAGTIVEVGPGIPDLSVGDRVACAGAGYAVHAEFASVPRLLVAKIPRESVGFEEAAFTTLGAVALHGIRTADVKLGDMVAVIGLGLVGQLTVQLLKIAGCRVLGMDITEDRAHLALRMGADLASTSETGFRDACWQYSGGNGVDAVVIAAETPSSDPVNLAAKVVRDRGKVVAVGTVGMDLERKAYYEKELDFRVSRSYGPGRYDAAYEQKGRDYPIGYVRWTETRNMEAFLHLLAEGKLDLQALITHRFPIYQAANAYDLIAGKRSGSYLGVLVTYSGATDGSSELHLRRSPVAHRERGETTIGLGVLGAGTFATTILLPLVKKMANVELMGACTASGAHARHTAEKFGFRYCTTDEQKIIEDPGVNAIIIATRHRLHAEQVLAALAGGKHVFCEKPLCLSESELREIVFAYRNQAASKGSLLMVGFNRRFAPLALRMKAFLQEVGQPLAMHYRVNAGFLPADHWVNDPEQGGGRILGEVCHFIDFLTFLNGAPPFEVQGRAVASPGLSGDDNVIVSLQFTNGSQGTISYLTSGDRSFSKERIEVFGGGTVAVLEDFRRLELVRHGRKQTFRSRFRQDKGHQAELQAFVNAIQHGSVPISFEEIVTSTLTTLKAAESRSSGQPIRVDAGFMATKSMGGDDRACIARLEKTAVDVSQV